MKNYLDVDVDLNVNEYNNFGGTVAFTEEPCVGLMS